MQDKDRQVLEKILRHVQAILYYNEDVRSLEDFQNNSMLVDASVFNLMQIGELAKQSLSDEAKSQISSIPWEQVYGLRNRIVHGYSGVSLRIVWDTILTDLPKLRTELETALSKQDQ